MNDENLPKWVKEPKTAVERLMQDAFSFGRMVGRHEERLEHYEEVIKELRKKSIGDNE